MAKNIYIGVDNVARKVKQPYIGVDNISRKVKSGFIGVDNVARQFFSGGTPLSALSVGTVVKLNESGVAQEYIIVNQGIPSGSSLYSSSCDGIWLLRKDILEKRVWANNSNNAPQISAIYSWLNSDMFAKYDSSIQSIIKQVKIPYQYNGGGRGNHLASGENGFSCRVFLLSGCEVGSPSSSYGLPGDGALLSYFESGDGTSARNKRIAYFNGKANQWWLRSPTTQYSNMAFLVYGNGCIDANDVSLSNGIRPAIIVPFETLVDSSMNIIAS